MIQSWVGVFVCLYGYPEGNEQRQANESLLSDTFQYISSLTVPASVSGDFNVSIKTSQVLALHWQYKLWKMGDDQPTTKGRHTPDSKKLAIDHSLCNAALLDCAFKVSTCRDWRLSDHYPLVAEWSIVTDPIMVWNWPKVTKLGEQIADPQWKGWGCILH